MPLCLLPAHRSEPGAERASQLSRAREDAGRETEATGAWKTCTIVLEQKRKNNCDTLMTDGESACFFFSFQNFILDILLFAAALANTDQNEGEAQLMFYLLSFTGDDCNLCLEEFFWFRQMSY